MTTFNYTHTVDKNGFGEPQPCEIVFKIMRYQRSDPVVQRSEDFQSEQCEMMLHT